MLRLSTYWHATCICLAAQYLPAQQTDTTISLPQAVVSAERHQPLVSKHLPHPSSIFLHGLSNLASKGLLIMPSYGPGQLTGLRAYGLPSAHTTVQWMGLTLNDHLTGQTDFSEIYPILFSDEVQIHSMGDRGGVQLDLSPTLNFAQPYIKGRTYLTERFGLGYSSSAGIRHRNARACIRLLALSNTNRYRIPHPQGPRYQQHATKNLFGGSAAIITPLDAHSSATVAAFFNSDHRQIPPTIDRHQSAAALRTLRKAIALTLRHHLFDDVELSIQGGVMHYRIAYTDTSRYIYFRANTAERRLNSKAHVRLGKHSHIRIETQWQYQSAQSVGFVDRARRWILRPKVHFSFTQKAYTLHISAGSLITARMPHQWLGQLSLSRSIRRQWSVALALNRFARLPSFNDLFWFEGGNPDLQPE